jgi:signal transduction histidine kinase/CheY-like chemotaxis protein
MSGNSESTASAAPHRAWYESVAGKLLLAFILIVALTLAATTLSISRFNALDSIVHRLIDVSLPTVRLSLEMESKATQVAVSAAQLDGIDDAIRLFEQNDLLSQQIQELWTGLGALQAVGGETDATRALQQHVSAMEIKLGELTFAANNRIALTGRRDQPIADALSAAETIDKSLGTDALRTSDDPAIAAAMQALRVESNRVAALLSRSAAVDRPERLAALRKEYAQSRERLATALDAFAGHPVGEPAFAALRDAVELLGAQDNGETGAFGLRDRELQIGRTIEAAQTELRAIGTDMRRQVAALVAQAERETADDRARSAEAIAGSRVWLIAIAVASLVLASLIVWLFVIRNVVKRLRELAGSMLAIARGDLDTPLPEGRPDELGDMRRALVVFRDNAREINSAREEAEKARAAAEAASRTKSAFLANMSHELRTPLNAIIGYSEILVEDAEDRGDEASVGDLHKIQTAGKHLLGLINDILDLSKIEAGRMDVYLEQVALAKLVAEVKTIVEPMVTKNGNRLVIECPPDIGTLRTDLTKLKQSLINLLSNAGKFTKDGQVTLSLSRTDGGGGASRIRFAVTDTGIGMTEEQVGRLFQAFTQADTSTTRNFGGTGLGLTITRHFCTMLGGDMEVASKPGKGSSFTVELPDQAVTTAPGAGVERRSLTARRDGRCTDRAGGRRRSDRARRAVARRSARRAIGCCTRTTAPRRWRSCGASRPDIVTLDVMMPKLDGWSVLGIMKSDAGAQHIPVIMLTIVDDRNLGFSLGASEFMTKPIDRQRLVALIRQFAGTQIEAPVLIVDDDAASVVVRKSASFSQRSEVRFILQVQADFRTKPH